MRIAFLDRNTLPPDITLPSLGDNHSLEIFHNTTASNTRERIGDAEVVITNKVIINKAVLDACPNIRCIGVAATGINVVDIEACRARKITVVNVTDYATADVAEHALMLMLTLTKQLKAYQRALTDGQWQRSQQFCFFIGGSSIGTLHGKTLGLIGTGNIAVQTAQLARAFGMSTLFFSPSGRSEVDGINTVSLHNLLASSDVVSIHCPLTEATEKLLNATTLKLMKPSALLINTARGPIVDIDALLAALRHRQIAGAGLDVLPTEPPTHDDPIMQAIGELDNLIVTPHTAWASKRAMQALVDQLFDKIADVIAGKPVTNLAS